MRILVTGGNGFIGSHVCDALTARGHDVLAMIQPGTAPGDHPFRVADLRDPAALRAAGRGVEVVCHLAARVLDYGPRRAFIAINVEGTRNLCAAARACGVRRIVHMSTLAVHGFRGHRGGREDAPRDARTSYGRTKAMAEDVVRGCGMEFVIVRPGLFPFGPRDRTSFLPLARALEAGWIAAIDGGDFLLSTAYAPNLAGGVALAAETGGAAGRTYLIDDGFAITWREMFRRISAKLGCAPPRWNAPSWLVLPAAEIGEWIYLLLGMRRPPPITRYRIGLLRRDFHFASDRARAELGYVPEVPFGDALDRTVAWYRTQNAVGSASTKPPSSATS